MFLLDHTNSELSMLQERHSIWMSHSSPPSFAIVMSFPNIKTWHVGTLDS